MGKLKEKMPKVDVKNLEKGAKGFWSEFKDFAMKGSVVDLAVGMVIGAAFTSIVNSLVNDLIMPLVGLATKGIDFTKLFVALDGHQYETLEAAQEAGAAVLTYGNFITAIINFLIVALALFLVLKKILAPKKKKVDEAPAAPTEKECPYCKSTVHIDATRCPHCTSELE